MPSFDVVSEVDMHELANAVDQTNRDVSGRFDFKGSDAKVKQEKDALVLDAETEFQIGQMKDILYQRMAKRGLDVAALKEDDLVESGKRVHQRLSVRQGIDKDTARDLVKLVKESKLKVQAAIQGEQLRITGKKRDDLQDAMALFRGSKIDLPLQYVNFRD